MHWADPSAPGLLRSWDPGVGAKGQDGASRGLWGTLVWVVAGPGSRTASAR